MIYFLINQQLPCFPCLPPITACQTFLPTVHLCWKHTNAVQWQASFFNFGAVKTTLPKCTDQSFKTLLFSLNVPSTLTEPNCTNLYRSCVHTSFKVDVRPRRSITSFSHPDMWTILILFMQRSQRKQKPQDFSFVTHHHNIPVNRRELGAY